MATKREQPLSSFTIHPRDDHSRQAVLRQAVSNSEMTNSRLDMDRGVITLAQHIEHKWVNNDGNNETSSKCAVKTLA